MKKDLESTRFTQHHEIYGIDLNLSKMDIPLSIL